jgi:hypothetical protein
MRTAVESETCVSAPAPGAIPAVALSVFVMTLLTAALVPCALSPSTNGRWSIAPTHLMACVSVDRCQRKDGTAVGRDSDGSLQSMTDQDVDDDSDDDGEGYRLDTASDRLPPGTGHHTAALEPRAPRASSPIRLIAIPTRC